jgi:hypothetical protein
VRDLGRFQRWYGRDEAPVERRTVRAGPVTAELDGPDLRYVRVGSVEVVRRLYAAVRDQNWGTVPPRLSNVELDVGADRFSLRFDARCTDDALGVDVAWRGELVGEPDGTLTCSFDGTAQKELRYNRIGWCILHPAENAGRAFRARTPDGVLEDRLPAEIGPQLIVNGLPAPLFPSFDRLGIEVADGVWARFELEGDLFETEDQRNWTDASFKTYSTPLALGFPHRAEAGTRFRQTVRLTIDDIGGVQSAERGDDVRIELGTPLGMRLPAVGLGAASHGRPHSARAAELLAALQLDHIRVDADLTDAGWPDALARGVAEARAARAALELAVVVDVEDATLGDLAAALEGDRPPIARVLAFRQGEPTSTAETVERVRDALTGAVGGAPVYGGTNVLFTDLNRFRPELGPLEGVAWPLNATVHASDDTSVVETAAMHGETVRSARAFCGDLPLAVTPVTFNQRFNPVATGPEPEPEPGELPSQVDHRQPSLLGAGWTLASVKSLAEAGAASVTYFETTGWRGLIESDEDSPAPERFASWPGMVFPVYHVFADLGEWKGGELVAASSSDPLAVEALAVRVNDELHVFVANLSHSPRRCVVGGLLTGTVRLRRLDDATIATACSEPEAFRAGATDVTGGLELELEPFELVRIDAVQ